VRATVDTASRFSGYTNEKGSIRSLSELHDSEDVHHHRIEPSDNSSSGKKKKVGVVQKEEPRAPPPEPAPAPAAPVARPKKLDGRLFLKDVVLSGSALIRADSDGTDSYVLVQEVGKDYKKLKVKAPKSTLIHDT
jgi:hypothetical protein